MNKVYAYTCKNVSMHEFLQFHYQSLNLLRFVHAIKSRLKVARRELRQYVIVIDWLSKNYGSKPTDTQGQSPRERFVYVAIIPWQPVNH